MRYLAVTANEDLPPVSRERRSLSIRLLGPAFPTAGLYTFGLGADSVLIVVANFADVRDLDMD